MTYRFFLLLLLSIFASSSSELVWSNTSQTNPLAGGSNYIVVAFKFNDTISGENTTNEIRFVLSGFNNAVASSKIQLVPVSSELGTFPFSDYLSYGFGYFQNSSLSFSLPGNASVLADVVYAFSFEIKNPYLNRNASDIFLSIRDKPGYSSMLLQSFYSELFGVPGGSAPMRVIIPLFVTANASQTNVLAGGLNHLVLTVRSNVLIRPYSNVTLYGLYGFLQEDGQSFVVSSDRSVFYNFSLWNASSASLTLFCRESIQSDSSFTFSVRGLNSESQQRSQDVKISAALAAGRYPVVIPRTKMLKSGLPLYGIPLGSDPLRIVVPLFLNVSALNRIHMAENYFALTLNISVNVDVLSGSTFSLSGLKNVSNVSNVRTEPEEGGWTQTGSSSLTALGIVELVPGQILYANRGYLMRLNVSVVDLWNASLSMQLSASLVDSSGGYIGQISPFSIQTVEYYVAESSAESMFVARGNISSCVVCRDKPENSYWEDACQCQWACKHGFWATYNKSIPNLYSSVNCTSTSEISSDLLVLGTEWAWISCPLGGS